MQIEAQSYLLQFSQIESWKQIMTRFGELLNRMFVNKTKLSESTGIKRLRISRLANEDVSKMNTIEAIAIAKALNISIEDFINEINPEKY